MPYKKKPVLKALPLFILVVGVLWIAVVGFLLQSSFTRHTQKQKRGFSGVSQEFFAPTPKPTPKPLVPAPLPGEKAMKVPILLYHYISVNPNPADLMRNGLSTAPAVFAQQLALLKSQGYTSMTLDELAGVFDGKEPLPLKPVIISVDDGYADFYYNAYPLLRQYQTKATEFIPTGLIGGGSYMTWGQIEELAKSPYVSFGAHSVHHYFLPKISPSLAVSEIVESKRTLEQHIGLPVNWFAYPYGAFNDFVVNEVKKAGFIGAITTLPGSWQYKSHFYYMPRYRAGNLLGASFLKLLN